MSAEGAKRVFDPLEIVTKNQKTLENLKSASRFRLIDLIPAITLYLPAVADPDQAFGVGQSNRGRQNVFTC